MTTRADTASIDNYGDTEARLSVALNTGLPWKEVGEALLRADIKTALTAVNRLNSFGAYTVTEKEDAALKRLGTFAGLSDEVQP